MATGDIIAAKVSGDSRYNGFALELTIGGWAGKTVAAANLGWTSPINQRGNDPRTDTPRVVVEMTSPGFAVVGGAVEATTLPRTVYGTALANRAHPDQAEWDTTIEGDDLVVRITLSQWVHPEDEDVELTALAGVLLATDESQTNAVSALAVTNESTQAYPRAHAAWVDRSGTLNGTRLGATYQGAVCALAGYGVAAARITLTDESANVAEQVLDSRVVLVCERVGTANPAVLPVSAYQASISTAGLTAGQAVTARARVYPRYGVAASVWDTAELDRAHNCNRTHRLAGSASWPEVYAYVDTANGDNGTGVASETPATARANPFAHMWQALLAVRDYLNTTYSRANSLDGAVIRLMDDDGDPQDFEWGRTGFAATMTAPGAAPRIEPDPENTAKVRYRTRNSTLANRHLLCSRVLISRVPVEPSASDQTNFFNGVTDQWYMLDRVEFVSESSSSSATTFSTSNVPRISRVSNKASGTGAAGSAAGMWGGAFPESDGWGGVLASNNSGFALGFALDAGPGGNWAQGSAAIANSVATTDLFFAHFEISTMTLPVIDFGAAVSRFAVGNGVMRRYRNIEGATGTQPLVAITNVDVSDLVFDQVSVIGNRFNLQVEASPNRDQRIVFLRNAHIAYYAYKGDAFADDGSITGNWSVKYGVGQEGIHNGNVDTFVPRFFGLSTWQRSGGTIDERDAGLVDPNTDATPSEGSQLIGLPWRVELEHDVFGTPMPEVGLASAGAVQRESDDPPPPEPVEPPPELPEGAGGDDDQTAALVLLGVLYGGVL